MGPPPARVAGLAVYLGLGIAGATWRTTCAEVGTMIAGMFILVRRFRGMLASITTPLGWPSRAFVHPGSMRSDCESVGTSRHDLIEVSRFP